MIGWLILAAVMGWVAGMLTAMVISDWTPSRDPRAYPELPQPLDQRWSDWEQKR